MFFFLSEDLSTSASFTKFAVRGRQTESANIASILGGIFSEIESNTNLIAEQLLHWTIIQVQEYEIYSYQRTNEQASALHSHSNRENFFSEILRSETTEHTIPDWIFRAQEHRSIKTHEQMKEKLKMLKSKSKTWKSRHFKYQSKCVVRAKKKTQNFNAYAQCMHTQTHKRTD